jgi:hypothetical protein
MGSVCFEDHFLKAIQLSCKSVGGVWVPFRSRVWNKSKLGVFRENRFIYDIFETTNSVCVLISDVESGPHLIGINRKKLRDE